MCEILSATAHDLPEPLLAADRGGCVLALNRAAAELLRLPGEAAGCVTLSELAQHSPAETDGLLRQALSAGTPVPGRMTFCPTGAPPFTRRVELWRIGGRDRPLAGLRILSQEGPYDRFLALTRTVEQLNREIHERQRIEQRLQEAMERAVAASQAKDQLLANVSHDLRTPLNAVIGLSEYMLQQPFGPLNDRYLEYTSGIHRSGRSLLEFVDRMLELVADDAALRTHVGDTLVDLSECLESVRATIEPLAAKKGLRLLLPPRMQLPRLRADQVLVKQILINLLGNAVAYTRSGEVGVKAARDADGSFVLSVFDTGEGIPAEQIETLLQPFHRGRGAYVSNSQGYGLGLSLVKRAIDALGAEMRFDSAPGEGTSVTVRFPERILERPHAH